MNAAERLRLLRRLLAIRDTARARGDRCAELIVTGRIRALWGEI